MRNIYSLFRQPLAHFHSLPFTSAFGLILPKNVPDYSSLCDVLLAYYIQFENVCCYYINLIDSRYSISSLKSFGSFDATIHKKVSKNHLFFKLHTFHEFLQSTFDIKVGTVGLVRHKFPFFNYFYFMPLHFPSSGSHWHN